MTRALRLSVLALEVVLLAAGPAAAVDKVSIDKAIERGVFFLKRQQLNSGRIPHVQIGPTALVGLTLLECGVPADDPVMQQSAVAIRNDSLRENQTYSVALSILFLDRLGDPADEPLIEALTIRLLSGQSSSGAWSYNLPEPSEAEVRQLSAALKQPPPQRPKPDDKQRDLPDPKAAQALLAKIRARRLDHMRDPMAQMGVGDNSNTQFAILALWVARRHGIPVDDALAECDQMYRRTQNADGGWAYIPVARTGHFPAGLVPPGSGSTPSMTCAALLGLAAGYGARGESALRTDPRSKEPSRPGTFPRARDPGDDPIIRSGLKALGTTIGNPVGNKPGAKVPRITQQSGRIYYFLWSLERVAVIFDLNTIGDKDWYGWGAEILLENQDPDGSWSNGEFREGNSDTCFALLFLKRANLAQDLTTSLKGRVKDPGKAELRSGGVGGAALARGLKPVLDPAGRVPDPGPDDDDGNKANRWAAALVEGTGAKQEEALRKLRDTKGAEYTQALAVAIAQLGGPAKKKAREALAERMTRMTAATLAEKLKDEDLEVRRAAALACAMKEDMTNFARIIDLLDDPEPPVARAAYAALKSLSGQDFGPAADASRAEKAKAIAAWKAWWKDQPKK